MGRIKGRKGEVLMFKKAFWIPYEDSGSYPTVTKTKDAISRYCAENGWSCSFPAEDAVIIDGKEYQVYRGYEPGSRGNYGIKCTEK